MAAISGSWCGPVATGCLLTLDMVGTRPRCAGVVSAVGPGPRDDTVLAPGAGCRRARNMVFLPLTPIVEAGTPSLARPQRRRIAPRWRCWAVPGGCPGPPPA